MDELFRSRWFPPPGVTTGHRMSNEPDRKTDDSVDDCLQGNTSAAGLPGSRAIAMSPLGTRQTERECRRKARVGPGHFRFVLKRDNPTELRQLWPQAALAPI